MGLNSLGAGTDFPVNPINPFLNMYIMVTRKDPNGNVYGSAETITREQAPPALQQRGFALYVR